MDDRKEMTAKIVLTQNELTAVFAEWSRRHRENPSRYRSYGEVFSGYTPEQLAEEETSTFISLLKEMRGESEPVTAEG